MPHSASGRVVLEIEPELKRRLYSALSLDGLTLKEWFIERAITYVEHHGQLELKIEARPTGKTEARKAIQGGRKTKVR